MSPTQVPDWNARRFAVQLGALGYLHQFGAVLR